MVDFPTLGSLEAAGQGHRQGHDVVRDNPFHLDAVGGVFPPVQGHTPFAN